jgi:tetratricopeptide (TPR) repeat protein
MDYKAYAQKAEEAFKAKNYAEALRLLTLVIEAFPKEGEDGYDPNELARLYYNRGLVYDELQEYNKALADYTKAIKLNKEYANPYNNRGNLYLKLKDYDKALADYNQAIKLNPNLADPYNGRGTVYATLKEYDKALADFSKAIELNPNLADPYNGRGIVYQELKEYDKALADYNQAIVLNPNNEIYYYNRFAFYKKRKEYENALKDFEEIKKLIHLDHELDNLFTEVVEIQREKIKDELEKLEKQKQGFKKNNCLLWAIQILYVCVVAGTGGLIWFIFNKLYAHHEELFNLLKSGQPYYELIAWKLTFIPFGVWLCYLLLAYIVKPLVSSLFTWSEKQKDLGYMQTLVETMNKKTTDTITESFAEKFEEKKEAQDTLITMTVARYHQFFDRSAMQMPEQAPNKGLLREIRLMIESILKNK